MSPPLRIWTVDRLLVCVPASIPRSTEEALRDLMASIARIDQVLELLTADGLAATPAFVCAAIEGAGARVVIRGDLEAVAHGRDGTTLVLSAGRSSTWNDDVVADIASISIDLGDEAGRFEWLACARAEAIDAVAPSASAPPASPAPILGSARQPAEATLTDEPDPHTLDGDAFLLLRDPEPDPTPEPEPAPDGTGWEVTATPPPADDVPADDGLDFSRLLDATSHRPPPPDPTAEVPAWTSSSSTTALAPRTTEPPPPPSPPSPTRDTGTGLGEHDGRTITLADLRLLQASASSDTVLAPPLPDAGSTGRQVRAVRCPQGHPNPTTAATCRRCGAAFVDRSVEIVPRPVVARLVFESGLVIDVDRPQLLGRRPMAPADEHDLPNLVTIPSPDGDISRGHAAVRLEGWDVLVEDLGSTNGTEVRLPGAEPVRLREHEPVLAVIGTHVTLAGAVRFTIQAPEQ